MEKRTYKIISFIIVFCLTLSSTTAVFANDSHKNYQANQTTDEIFFTLNGEEYKIEKEESETATETQMYDSQENLVGHLKYEKYSSKLFDLLNNREIPLEITQSARNVKSLVDSEGYYYQGKYTLELGYVVSAASLILTLVTRGYGLTYAQAIAAGVVSFGSSFIYIKYELWMKTDATYDYVKRIESVYERVSEKNNKLGGPYTFYQKKAR